MYKVRNDFLQQDATHAGQATEPSLNCKAGLMILWNSFKAPSKKYKDCCLPPLQQGFNLALKTNNGNGNSEQDHRHQVLLCCQGSKCLPPNVAPSRTWSDPSSKSSPVSTPWRTTRISGSQHLNDVQRPVFLHKLLHCLLRQLEQDLLA